MNSPSGETNNCDFYHDTCFSIECLFVAFSTPRTEQNSPSDNGIRRTVLFCGFCQYCSIAYLRFLCFAVSVWWQWQGAMWCPKFVIIDIVYVCHVLQCSILCHVLSPIFVLCMRKILWDKYMYMHMHSLLIRVMLLVLKGRQSTVDTAYVLAGFINSAYK